MYKNGAKKITDFGKGSVKVEIPYEQQKGENAGSLYAVYLSDYGEVSILSHSVYDADRKVLSFLTNHFSAYGIGYKTMENQFNDIEKHWAKDAITFTAARGIFKGSGNHRFSPDQAMTRGMFVTLLGRMAGVDISKYKAGSFTDVKEYAYYAPYVDWAVSSNIISEKDGKTFKPKQAISRQEMTVIMAKYAKAMGVQVPKTREAVAFTDKAKIADWAKSAVKTMQMAGIVNAKKGNKFDPAGKATRAEAAAMLARYIELMLDITSAQGLDRNDSGKFIYYENGKLFTGKKIIDGKTYNFGSDIVLAKNDVAVPEKKKYVIMPDK